MGLRLRRYLRTAVITAVLAACLPGAVSGAAADGEITTKEQLNRPGMRVGVSTGSGSVLIVEKELPEAEKVYYDDTAAAYEAVAQGKLDAFVYDRIQMQLAIDSGRNGVHLLDGNMDEGIHIAAGISPVSGIPDLKEKMNAFIAEKRADGTLDEMYERWVIKRNETMPEIAPAKDPQYTLKVGTSGIVPPYSYYVGTDLNGYDIEMAYRFAAWLGAEAEFRVYDYGAIIAAAATGDVDCILANLNVTPERAEALPFSDDFYVEKIGIMVRGEMPEAAGYTAVKDLNGKRIGIQTGTSFDQAVTELLPDSEIAYFNTRADIVNALLSGRIEAFALDGPAAEQMLKENESLAIVPEYMEDFTFAYVFPKTDAGQALCSRFSEFLHGITADGTLEEIKAKWFGDDDSLKTIADYRNFPAPNGVLQMATESEYEPFTYLKDMEVTGYDVDIAVRFCEAYGYGLAISDMRFDSILPAVQTGKADFAGGGISITEERKESVLFSEPNYAGGTVLVVRKEQQQAGEMSFAEGIRESFNKTFIRENRWRLFTDGILNTLLITVLSMICGTALGFGVFMLCRNGNPAANAVTRFALWLIQGTPMVVLLMILYYIVFGSVAISGLAVAVIGFSLTFGASVFGLLKMGVGAVDRGQYEAAYALGHTNRHTFFRIIIPQALPHVTSSYKGEIVSLIKATSIVGYIAVQDLTKMGDIVRSRTYEAFFPLIAVTVIYFVLEALIGLLVSRITMNTDPKRRKPEHILKGVKTGD